MTSENLMVSIIIPAYNAERFIADTLDSLIGQTYHNLEIVVVNDGSSDSTFDILTDYASKDNRVKVINQTNSGQSAARNAGLRSSHGDLVTYVDSDDWLSADAIEKIVVAFNDDTDIVMYDYVREYPTSSNVRNILSSNQSGFTPEVLNEYVLSHLFGPPATEHISPDRLEIFNPLWNKTYRKNVIKGISQVDLSEIGSSEDLLFNISAFTNSKGCRHVSEPLYHYRRSVGESSTAVYRAKLTEQWIHLFDLINSLDSDGKYKQNIKNRESISLLFLGLNIMKKLGGKYLDIKKLIS